MFPILFRVGGFPIYAYGFLIGLGFVAGLILSTLNAKKEGMPFERVVDLFFSSVLSAILGSRILFVLINFDSYRRDLLQIFKIWEGGLVFYGGLILAIGVATVYMKWHRLPLWKLADLFSPPVALGLFFGRIGCFLAGCCYGKETSLPWGVVFTNANSLARLYVPLHPTQLYEAAGSLALFFFLNWKLKNKSFDGQIIWLFLFSYSVFRFFIEIFRDDPRKFVFQGLLSTSQAIGILLAITSLFMLFFLKRHRIRTGGL
jgi:phosphatidylglycerol:prolipoprotein diacylglycerol transferase